MLKSEERPTPGLSPPRVAVLQASAEAAGKAYGSPPRVPRLEGREGSSPMVISIQESFIIELLGALGALAPWMQSGRRPRSSHEARAPEAFRGGRLSGGRQRPGGGGLTGSAACA